MKSFYPRAQLGFFKSADSSPLTEAFRSPFWNSRHRL